MAAGRKLFIIVVGCGRMGSYIANRLSHDGHGVVVIDVSESAFGGLSAEFSGFKMEGDATEFETLKQAKVEKADLVIATTHQDNVNVMVAQVARHVLHVPKVIARVFEPKRERVYRELDIEIISPVVVAGDLFLKSVRAIAAGDGAADNRAPGERAAGEKGESAK